MNFSNCIKYSNNVNYSPNGNYLAIAKGNNLLIYESNQMKNLFKYSFTSQITQIEFSQDSSFILIGLYKLGQCEVKSLLDENWKCKINESLFGISNSIWTPDNSKILCFSNCNVKLSIWSLTEECQAQYISLPKFSDKGYSFSSNGHFFALAERKEIKDYIGVYYIADFSLMSHFNINTVDVQDIVWSKDNTSIIASDCPLECKILVYSPTGSLLMINEAYTNILGVTSLVLSPNGHYITGGYGDSSIRLYNHITYKQISILKHQLTEETFKGEQCYIFREVEFNIEQNKKGTKFEALQYNNKLFNKIKSTSEETGIDLIDYSYDSNYLASRLKNIPNILWIWQIASLSLSTIIIFKKDINSFKWSPNEHKIIIGTDNSKCYVYTLNNIYVVELPAVDITVKTIKWNYDGRSFLLCDKYKLLIGFSEIDQI